MTVELTGTKSQTLKELQIDVNIFWILKDLVKGRGCQCFCQAAGQKECIQSGCCAAGGRNCKGWEMGIDRAGPGLCFVFLVSTVYSVVL